MDGNIDIIVQDRVAVSISQNLKLIATSALEADKNIAALNTRIGSISVAPITQLAAAAMSASAAILKASQSAAQAVQVSTAQSAAMDRSALSAARMSTELQRTAKATAEASVAQLQLKAAQDKAAQTALKAANAATSAAVANNQQASAARAAAAANDVNTKSMQNASSAKQAFARIGAAVGTIVGAGEILKMADAYTVMQNKLQNVTGSQEQVNELTGRLFELSNGTRTSISSTTTAFVRFDRSLQQMGKSQEDTLRMTETINKALIVSGATASESSSALLQLSQAFNSGKLNGDEFRAVSENMPVVLDAVAKTLGKPISQVKKLASEGKISAEVLYNAFKLIEKQIDDTFAKTIPTMSQSMVYLQNKMTQFFGEMDKKMGVTQGISQAIIWLAKNLDTLAVAASVAAAVYVASLGPALSAGTLAVLKFSAALLTNPFGLMLVGAAALVSYITFMGDKIDAGTSGFATLRDVGVAAFDELKSIASDAVLFWSSFFTTVNDGTRTMSESTNTSTTEAAGYWDSLFVTQETGWAKAAVVAARAFDSIVWGIRSVYLVGKNLFGMLFDYVGAISGSLADVVTKAPLDAVKSIEERFKKVEFKTVGAAVEGALTQAFTEVSTTGMESKVANIFKKADATAAARIKESQIAKKSTLRGTGKNTQGTEPDKGAKKRVDAMDKTNLKLDDEIARMNMLAPLREQEAKYDQIKEQMASKGITISAQEEAAFRSKIKTIYEGMKVQSEMDRMYQDAVGPSETYNNTLKAAEILLKNGGLSREQYNQQLLKSGEAYKNAMDPMREEMNALRDQNTLLTYLPKQREIEAKVMEKVNANKAQNIALTTAQIDAYRTELQLLQQKNLLDVEKNALLDNSVTAREKYITQMQAIKALQSDPKSGFTAGDASTAVTGALGAMGIETQNLQVSLDSKTALYQTQYTQLAEMRAQDLISEQDYSDARAQIAEKEFRNKYQAADNFFGSLAGLQSSSVKELAMIGKAAAITQAVINTHVAATKAWADGGIYGGVMAAIVVAKGMAEVAAIRSQGFMTGGYTGNGATNDVAGVVHKREFVMTAATTARVGPSDLQALQDGSARIQRNNEGAGKSSAAAVAQSVSANAPATTTQAAANNVTVVNSLDPAMVGDFLARPEGEAVFMNTIRRNGDTIKQMLGN